MISLCVLGANITISNIGVILICGLYYKPMKIVNDDSRVVNKLEASPADDARVVIYNCHMFIVQVTGKVRLNFYLAKPASGHVSLVKHHGQLDHTSIIEQYALKNANYCLNTIIYSYLETSCGQISNLYINAANFFNTSVN